MAAADGKAGTMVRAGRPVVCRWYGVAGADSRLQKAGIGGLSSCQDGRVGTKHTVPRTAASQKSAFHARRARRKRPDSGSVILLPANGSSAHRATFECITVCLSAIRLRTPLLGGTFAWFLQAAFLYPHTAPHPTSIPRNPPPSPHVGMYKFPCLTMEWGVPALYAHLSPSPASTVSDFAKWGCRGIRSCWRCGGGGGGDVHGNVEGGHVDGVAVDLADVEIERQRTKGEGAYGVGQRLPVLAVDECHHAARSLWCAAVVLTGLPETSYIAFDVSGNTSVCKSWSRADSISLFSCRVHATEQWPRIKAVNIPKCGGGFQIRLLYRVYSCQPSVLKFSVVAESRRQTAETVPIAE
ncbi:hypothetical protein FH972_026612 [Carpinus fangiana]|uniref:Uncharacterized protein n=1 Tax=Carpinus fangiana TaxID=176857 RepID=A0A5N6L4L5_9ROSI|nr:hypothetical protein FH972_026612 [Carpinus fangiana]